MSSTIIEQANDKAVSKKMADPEYMKVISEYVKKLRNGFFDEKYVNIIMQKWERFGEYDIYDAYPFSQVHTELGEAKIIMAKIHLGFTPSKDKSIDENNQKLNKLFHPFSGEFWGGTQDEDGRIVISEPVWFQLQNQATKKLVRKKVSGSFPLEVGYTSAAKTRLQLSLSSGGRLARWPYDDEYITLMYRVNGDWINYD